MSKNQTIMRRCIEEAKEVLREHMPKETTILTVEECNLANLLYIEKTK